MKCLVTGAAGFIGSHLCERLLHDGHDVVGLDAFIPYYPRPIKEANLAALPQPPAFPLAPPRPTRRRPDAGPRRRRGRLPPGRDGRVAEKLDRLRPVRKLQRRGDLPTSRSGPPPHASCTRFVYVSTSSVYGRYSSGDETLPTRPISPYGVTKLAGENLCRAFADEHGLPLVVLRYFSVYGPRQRPDMGYYRFIHALLHGDPVTVFGDGQQMRGNTYVDDCVAATVGGAERPARRDLQRRRRRDGIGVGRAGQAGADHRQEAGDYSPRRPRRRPAFHDRRHDEAVAPPRLATASGTRRRPGTAGGVAARAGVAGGGVRVFSRERSASAEQQRSRNARG